MSFVKRKILMAADIRRRIYVPLRQYHEFYNYKDYIISKGSCKNLSVGKDEIVEQE